MNGAKFDKLMRPELRKDDDSLRILRKLAPSIAKTVDDIDMKFAEILARLQKIEDTHDAHVRIAPRLAGGREPNGEEVLNAMRTMTPAARDALIMKLKQ